MKNILIISENDLVCLRLMQLYYALFQTVEKNLYLCTIDIVDCHQGVPGHFMPKIGSLVAPVQQEMPKMMQFTPDPEATFSARSCLQINKLIDEYQIDLVLIPKFTYDNQRSNQYEQIIRAIKRHKDVDVVGLYV